MTDPAALIALSTGGLAAVGLASLTLLRGWNGWIELKRLEVRGEAHGAGGRPASEIQRLRERVRRLEAIAEGR